MLVNKNILLSRNDKAYEVFTNYITNDFIGDLSLAGKVLPSDYVSECWDRYKCNASPTTYECSNSLNGKIFEVIIATALYRSKVLPFYYQATAKLVPDVDYDIIMYDKKNEVPITISVKTSARERYKQADLEAYAFSNVHRTALNYLVMLDADECRKIRNKIADGSVLGLNKAIQADTSDFDDLVRELKTRKLGPSPKVTLFEGQKISK